MVRSILTLMLLVANITNAKLCQKADELTENLAYGTHLRELSGSLPMNFNMTGFRWFPKIFASFGFGRK